MSSLKKIRPANSKDLSELAPLFDAYRVFYAQVSDLPVATNFLCERLTRKDSVILVAEDEDEVLVGFTQLYPTFSSVSVKRTWILNDLYVNATHRKHGIATSLINAALEFARDTKAAWVSLETGIHNSHAQALYEKIGFKQDECFLAYSFDLRN